MSMTMILDAPADISETDAQMIVAYLAAQSPSSDSGTGIQMEVARALVDQRCARCHTLDRVYKSVQVPDKWRETVTRMVQYAAGSSGAFEPGEAEQIIAYLSATQTPEAANLKPAQADAASASGRSLITQRKDVTPLVPAQTARRNIKSIGFIFVRVSRCGGSHHQTSPIPCRDRRAIRSGNEACGNHLPAIAEQSRRRGQTVRRFCLHGQSPIDSGFRSELDFAKYGGLPQVGAGGQARAVSGYP
jgi:mono/diheme cytochrome c family protein